jgi:RNA polymerase sigma-70 factor (ECF subfamily)
VDSDEDLLEYLRAGDDDAFAILVERYHPSLIKLARSFVCRPDIAEDIAQETWIAVLRGIGRFEARSALRTWLFQICANRARSIAVLEHRTIPVEPYLEPGHRGGWSSQPAPWASSTQDEVALITKIHKAILDLPEAQRRVVTMRDVEGRSGNEVCRLLSITEANQRVLLHRGRERVRRQLRAVPAFALGKAGGAGAGVAGQRDHAVLPLVG